ncbi:hypothetical protein [Gulosibacter sp. 10]|uniref:hypothetical protein n=1 Tax=Gulosibacter sp. 10 TaxID=1255570 RepID=UPI00111CD5ED|nr:hypothetical protein [Gulosibacter sp. 10]
MVRSRRNQGIRRSRGSRSRHGRSLRSSVAGPHLPQLTGRIPRFHQVVGETLGFLRAMAPDKMRGVRVGVSSLPPRQGEVRHGGDGMARWQLVDDRTVVVYRVPIERFARLSLSDPRDQIAYREYVEHLVIHAVDDLLGGGLEEFLGH